MSRVWNDCLEIYEDGEFTEHFIPSMFAAWNRYTSIVHGEPKLNVWYDTKSNICFGLEQDFYKNPNDFTVFSQKGEFKENKFWGLEYINKNFGCLGLDLEITEEFIIQRTRKLHKFKGKKILIVGAGPSAKETNWNENKYDYVWSCTNFFLNDKLSNVNLGLVSLGGNTSLEDERLNDYLSKTDTLCGIDCGVTPAKKPVQLINFKNKYFDRTFYFHTRFFSKLGAAARLLCLATLLEASEISIAGLDGLPVGNKHSFEGEKKQHDTTLYAPHMYDLFRRQYVLLWDYVLGLDKSNKIKYINLGEECEGNLSSDISKQNFLR